MFACFKKSAFIRQTRAYPLSSKDGFTLIEVVVALTILALAVHILFNLISDSINRISFASSTAKAVLLAQSILAKVGTEIPLHEGDMAGHFSDNFRWQLRISPWGDPIDRKLWPINAYEVSTVISWKDGQRGRSFILRTLRLGPKDTQ